MAVNFMSEVKKNVMYYNLFCLGQGKNYSHVGQKIPLIRYLRRFISLKRGTQTLNNSNNNNNLLL